MKRIDIDNTNEDGFTLIDMVVTMVIGGALTIMIFNLSNTSMQVSEIVAQPVARTIATQSALNSLGEAVRNSPDQRATDDGRTLYILDQENKYTAWRVGEDGLSNGIRTYGGVKNAHFKDEGGLIRVTLTTEDDQDVSRSFRSHFPAPAEGESVFTDMFLATHAPAG